jgi:hypothetical protein
MGDGLAFTQTEKMMVPLFERIRNQYCVLRLSPVTVRVVVFAVTVVEARPCVKVELVALSMVNPVSLLELSTQFKITERFLLEFGPFTAVKLPGAAGCAGTDTEAVFE